MKRLFLAFFFLLPVLSVFGQYGNEWIEFGRPWLKIPVAKEGLYRVTYAQLQQAAGSITADPKTFRLFHRGVEQAIRVQGEDDGTFDANDYIEFYGRANDGSLDSTLYERSSYQPHRYYNLFTDTTAYFLTYGGSAGKRMKVATGPSAGLTPEPCHWAEKLLILRDNYSSGIDYGNVQKTIFDQGEGWMGPLIRQGEEASYTLDEITGGKADYGKPQIEVLLTGRGPMNHQVDLYAGTRLLTSISFGGFDSYRHIQELEWSDVDANGKVAIKMRVTGAAGVDRVSADYVRVRFPQETSMTGSGKIFTLPGNSTGVSLLRISAPVPGTRLFDITDPDATAEIPATLASSLDAVVPFTTVQRQIFAAVTTLSPVWIKRVSFRILDPASSNYIVITHPSLRKPALGYIDPVKAYAEYRSLPEGGGFDTLVVNVDQLYDQFNYGEASPRAIFQFMKYMASVRMPEYLFLIGKGLDVNYGYRRNPGAFTEFKDLVPTAGYPASDMAFTAGLSGFPWVAAVATGRLSATQPSEVAAYLNKVKERDALPFDDLRRKRILHLSGGIEESEPAAFRAVLADLQSVVENVYLGANVQAVSKGATNISVVNIADEVNAGLGVITFFGHSAPNTLDFDIGLVSDPVMGYDNKGKYPFLFMNGCNAGSFFLNGNIFGENWVKTADKGAIGFIAHSSYGLLSSLKRYASAFYDVAFADSVYINKSVGAVQREVARRFLATYGTAPESVSQTQEMMLLGDPALKLFGAGKPDHAVDASDIFVSSLDGNPVTVYSDSFDIHIPVRNYGIAVGRRMRIEAIRQSAEGTPVAYDTIVPATLYADTVALRIRNPDKKGYGINTFSIKVDADDLIDELSESNNTTSYEFFIPSASTRNLYPSDFAIVANQDVRLSFQNTNLSAGERGYIVEVDTVNTFDSGFKQQFALTATVLAGKSVHLLDLDTTVYYWRTRFADPGPDESAEWAVSSFTYIDDGPEGWAQIRFPQWEANDVLGLVADPVLQKLRYKETVSDIAIRTFSTDAGRPIDSISVKINRVEFNLLHEGGACRNNTVNFIAFDRKSTQPYAGIYFKWYELLYDYGGRQLLCGREPYVINSFTPQELVTGHQDDLVQYLDNVHAGDSVVLFNIGNAGYSQWPASATAKLSEIGVSLGQLAGLQDGEPLVVFGRKGAPEGSAAVFRAPAGDNALLVKKTIAGKYTAGIMTSPIIGPAQRWGNVIFQMGERESTDSVSFSIVGITPQGMRDTLRTNAVSGEDLSFIDPDQYPLLQLVYKTADDIGLTPVPFGKWLVAFDPVPEGLAFYRGTSGPFAVAEGEPFASNFGFVNVTEKTFSDSLTVRYELLNHLHQQTSAQIRKVAAPAPGDTTLFTLEFNTRSKQGLNDVSVFVNPRIAKERSYDNNVVVLTDHVNVLSDVSHPVVEVTFDGRTINNLDFVRPSPEIMVRLWDENKFLLKKDTIGVQIFLAYPCENGDCAFRPVYFTQPGVQWQAATDTSPFVVTASLANLPDGTYTLRVSAADAKGNLSGETPYEISFRVAHGQTVSAMPAHPNPFYLQTYFDVTVTGDTDALCHYALRLYTPQGQFIREFLDGGIGMHTGTNRITWDGLDGAGSSMPNGIYIYRLVITRGSQESEYNGRVVLLR